jgi:hypothetical protein
MGLLNQRKSLKNKGDLIMALIKEKTEKAVTFKYHTPIIMQNGKKKTTVAVSSWVNAASYLAGDAPYKSRWGGVAIDKKYPTAAEIYAKLTESRLDADEVETNWLADAVSDE